MRDVIIVGGGLFGSIAAEALRSAGMGVELIDRNHPLSGSRAAGCLMKPSWLQKMGSLNVDKSFQLLDRLYGLRSVYLHAGPLKVGAEWINPDRVLGSYRRFGTVKRVDIGQVTLIDGEVIEAPTIIVAGGFWTRLLVTGAPVTGKMGVSIRLSDPPEDNRIKVWAPYKQLVRFSKDNFHWAGDGTAIIVQNWTAERKQTSLDRITEFSGEGVARTGIRPFVKTTEPAALENVAPGIWSLTGGGKNGTAAAGWAAAKLLEILT